MPMRVRSHLIPALALTALWIARSVRAEGQPATVVRVEEKPRHHVVFENEAVRVIDARLPAGDVTLHHTHAADNVPVVIRGGPLTIQPLGGAPQRSVVRAGEASLARASYTHQIANIGPGPLRFVDVEIHTAWPPRGAGDPPVPAGHQVLVDDARVRVLRHRVIRADPDLHAGPVLAVAVPPGHEEASNGPLGAPAPGSYWWREARSRDVLLPPGTEVVEIELKGL